MDAAKKDFQWSDIYAELDWLPGGYLNQAHECIDRHVEAGRGDKTAMIWVGKNGEEERYTFSDMKRETAKFANVLEGLGVQHGERVFVFMERLPELYFAMFGVLKHGAVVGPLFSAFGPDPVRDRMEDSGATVLLTQPELRKRIAEVLPNLPALQHIIIVNKNGRSQEPLAEGDLSYEALMAEASDEYETANTSMYDYSVIHYTSGTTGKPKGAAHRHLAVVQQYATGKWVLDFHPDDLYWCTADPGWVTGTSYGMFAPWSNGITQLIYEGGFGASAWYQTIEKYGVTVWYTAPTAVRMLMKAGEEVPRPLQPLVAAAHQQRRRAAEPGGRRLGHQGLRPAHPRQLVADGNGRHHGRQLPCDGSAPRFDGPPHPRHRGGDPGQRLQPASPRRRGVSRSSPRLALHVPHLLEQPGHVQHQVPQGLVHLRRPVAHG